MKTKKEYTNNDMMKIMSMYQKQIAGDMRFFKVVAIIGIILWVIGVVISL